MSHWPENVHPASCACSWCHRADEEARSASKPTLVFSEPIPLDTWDKDPKELARLLRWLAMREIPVDDVPAFLEDPLPYADEFEQMLIWSPKDAA